MQNIVSVAAAAAEVDMTEEEVIELIRAEAARDFTWHVLPVNSGSTILRPTLERLASSGGIVWNNRAEGQNFIISAQPGAANKIAEYAYTRNASDDPLEIKLNPGSDVVKHWDEHVNRVECFMGIYQNHSNLSATQYVGLEFGTCNQGAPLPEGVPLSEGVVQLRWRSSTDTWWIYSNPGDSTTNGTSTQLTGVTGIYDSSDVPHGVYAALEWDPVNQTVSAYINGKLGTTVSGAVVPQVVSAGLNGVVSGIFAVTGSDANGQFTALHFSGYKHVVKDFLDGVT